MSRKSLQIVSILLAVVVVWAVANHFWGAYLTLEQLKVQQSVLADFYTSHQLAVMATFFLVYVAVTAISLPGAAVMTLAGGAIFGFWTGLVLVSFASTIGATGAFLVARFLLRDTIQKRFGHKLSAINRGFEKEGAFYLFTLRLIPLFPFFLINLLMALTPMPSWTFFSVSQVGMLAGTAVYINAGTQLARIDSLGGILSWELILSFALIGIFPLLAKRTVAWVQQRRIAKRYPKPRQFEYDLAVIGGGSAGLVSAYIGRALKAKVALIEQDKMGGDCLNTGCVPSKALLYVAHLRRQIEQAGSVGLDYKGSVDFERVMDHVRRSIEAIEPHDSVARYQGELGAECLLGKAVLVDPYHVRVGERVLSARNIIIATGAKPMVPDIDGLEQIAHYTSESIWRIKSLPKNLVVLGGGPIGCELAQAFSALGSRVTLVQRGDRLLPREEPEASALMASRFQKEGIHLMLGCEPIACSAQGIQVRDRSQSVQSLPCDALLIALGRRARTSGFGLESLGVALSADGTIETNEAMQTNYPNLYACGDVAGPYQFTHTASHQAWYAAVNALIRPFYRFKADYRVIPWCTFTEPQVARVGLSEAEAKAQGVAYEVTRYDLADLDRAIAEANNEGFVKVLTHEGKDTILGVTIAAPYAGELISEWVLAMKQGIGLNKLLGTIHIYPTYAEANRFAAGNWKKAHAPQKVLVWVERFHRWRRS